MAAHAHYIVPGKNYTCEPDLLVQLIAEDLKAHFFFSTLAEVGYEDYYFQPGLGDIVLTRMGFNREIDEHLDLYNNLIFQYSIGIGRDRALLRRNAEQVYSLLLGHSKEPGVDGKF